ncbi:Ger(x)C family spore germination protein [Paenibacillus cremeus]|uniref:Ger(X)C family spore germination protein n=1 Tax=Paenibacillus cremeus TaxID=2163881 RepID=A0A559KG74_9BACL|nr:Ger(x)C family spore germination protein [Paenibacillus cremeus]TVY11129.1 Ger(x)C family spore germination protein [Paenibacillus cremeus]
MKWSMAKWLTIFFLFVLSGCWDKFELIEFGFVQAIAIDQTEDGKIELTSHFYKPAGGGEGGTAPVKEKGPINIRTTGDTIFDAIRDIATYLGRKAKFDHMRVILISEQVAKTNNIEDILEFFSRDHEPRATFPIMITMGRASSYLDEKPFIENTMGQQLRKMEETTSRYSGKTVKTNLLELAIQMKSEVGIARFPYVYRMKNELEPINVAGIAIVKKGKLADIVSPEESAELLMMTDQYEGGIIKVPCHDQGTTKQGKMDSFEVDRVETKLITAVEENSLRIRVKTKIKGAVGELHCAPIVTNEEEKKFSDHVQEKVTQEIKKVVEHLQKKKLDAIGIGNQIYRKDPSLWKRWKKDWDERFARSQLEIAVDVTVTDTGMNVGKPLPK